MISYSNLAHLRSVFSNTLLWLPPVPLPGSLSHTKTVMIININFIQKSFQNLIQNYDRINSSLIQNQFRKTKYKAFPLTIVIRGELPTSLAPMGIRNNS